LKNITDLCSLIDNRAFNVIEEEIIKNELKANELTFKSNWCAIITNGTAILGYGDIGAVPGLPVMEVRHLILFESIFLISCKFN